MMTENSMNTEIPENDGGNEPEITKAPNVEESIREAVAELKEPDETEIQKESQADKDTEGKKPTAEEAREAAKTLAKAKRGAQKKRVIHEFSGGSSEVVTDEISAKKLEAPQSWPTEKKEWFNRQAPEAQEELVRDWNGIQGHTTKLWQDLNRNIDRYRHLDQVITHYMPGWNLRGMSDVQAVAELCATQDLLLKDRVAGCDLLLQKTGTSLEELQAYRQGAPRQVQQRSNTQQNSNGLNPEDVRKIVLESLNGAQEQTANQAAIAELTALRNETNPDGRYKYPELWGNDSQSNFWNAGYVQRVQPLVDSIQKTKPGIPIVEATKQAINWLRNLDGNTNGSPSLNGQRLSQEQELAKIKTASSSVRGRGNGAIPRTTRAKPGESLEDTIRSTMAGLRQN